MGERIADTRGTGLPRRERHAPQGALPGLRSAASDLHLAHQRRHDQLWCPVVQLAEIRVEGPRRAVEELSPQQLSTPYRPGGWTVRQFVHHIPDSHMNGYVRTKLALSV